MNRLLSLTEAAKLLNVSKETLRRWTRLNKVPVLIVNKRGDRRFRQEDIERFMKGE